MALDRDTKAANADTKTANPESLSSPQDTKPHYDEATTFSSEPIPKDSVFGSSPSESDIDSEAYQTNPFLDPDVAAKWALVYEKSQYECRHVFDPEFTWTKEEEKKLVRRLDWRVCLWAVSAIIFSSRIN
jgi:hypothetical protein